MGSESDAKIYVRKGFLMYEEMRKLFPIFAEAVRNIGLCSVHPIPLNFLIYEENFYFLFLSV